MILCFIVLSSFCILLYTCANVICIKFLLINMEKVSYKLSEGVETQLIRCDGSSQRQAAMVSPMHHECGINQGYGHGCFLVTYEVNADMNCE